ncbi:DUF402 domain-containing protein [Actinopolymorpha singaporensis]
MAVAFRPGQVVVRRCLHPDGRLAAVQCARVVADDERGLAIWIGAGSTTMRRVDLHGEPTRHLPYAEELAMPTMLAPTPHERFGTLILTPADAGHSVAWAFDTPGELLEWYVNLESPVLRWSGGIDVFDFALDVLVRPDRRWEWKDEDDFADQTGHPLFWTAAEAKVIRARAEAVTEAVDRGEFPFDGTWCDYLPEPGWGPTPLPTWWDLPTLAAPRVDMTAVGLEQLALPRRDSPWVR